MNNANNNAADLAAYASILVTSLAHAGIANETYWKARATETYPIGSNPAEFAPYVLRAATDAGRVIRQTPCDVCLEALPDGSARVRLSSMIRVY